MWNSHDGLIEDVPNPLNGKLNPGPADAFAAGYRMLPGAANPGYVDVHTGYADAGDGQTCVRTPPDMTQADYDAHQVEIAQAKQDAADQLAAQQAAEATALQEAKQAQFNAIIQSVTPIAQLYRATLRSIFGANAETNTTISQEYVEGYFAAQISANGTLTTLQLTQEIVLSQGFQVLSKITADSTTWSFPWDLIP